MTTFNSKSPQLQLRIDRTMAESLGVTMNGVFQTLQTYLGSTYVNLFNKFNQSFQVRVKADADYRRRLDDVANLYVANRSSQMVPLGSLVDVRRVLGSELITHYNLYPAAPLVGSPAPGYSSGEAPDIMERVASANLPQNMGYNWTGLSYQEKLRRHARFHVIGNPLRFRLLHRDGRFQRTATGKKRNRNRNAQARRLDREQV